MKLINRIGIFGKQVIVTFLVLGLLMPSSAFAAEPAKTANSPAVVNQLGADLLALNMTRSELRNPTVRVGFENPEKAYTNSVAVYQIGNLFHDEVKQIPDAIVKAVKVFLSQHIAAGRLKSLVVYDFAGSSLLVHTTHNYGERNASVHRIMLDAVREGLEKARSLGLVDIDLGTLSAVDLVKKLHVVANDDSKVERGAESVVIAVGVGVTPGAANIKLFHEFAVEGSTPLKKLGLQKSPGFRFRVKRTQDIFQGKLDGPEWEFEISSDQYDDQGQLKIKGKNEGTELLALASQPNDYQVTAVYPVEGGGLPATEPIATVIYQPVYGTDGTAVLNPVIIYRSQSGADAVGGIANKVYDVNFVPGGKNGDFYVATKPVTLKEARTAPKEGIGYFATYMYQSRNNGEIPTEGVRDHVAFNPSAYGFHRELADELAAVMSDQQDDQPYLSPGASERLAAPIREEQDHLFLPAPKESEEDPFLRSVNERIVNGTFVAVTDDKADMGGRIGHTNVPEMMIAIYRATLMEAIESGTISYGNTVGFAGDHTRVRDTENVGVGDDGHLLMIGDKSTNGAEAHQLSFLAFTRAYLFAVLNGKKYYGTGQDFAGPEAQAAKKSPFFYAKLTPHFFEILRQMMPKNEIGLGVIENVQEKWEEWQAGGEQAALTEPFSGNVSQQGIGSARYAFNPQEEGTFDIIAGDKMGPAALNRLIKHTVARALKTGDFKNGFVLEIWDLKSLDEHGNIQVRDIPTSYADVKTLGYKNDADRQLVANAYVEGKLKADLSAPELENVTQILKRSGFVPSRRVFLDAEKNWDAIVRYLADSDRFNVKHVWAKSSPGWDIENPQNYLDRPLLGASVTRLGILTGGEYIGKDDPVIVGNSKLLAHAHEFLRTHPLIIQGDMNGSHWEWAVPSQLKYAVATVRSFPVMVGLRYRVSKDGKRLVNVSDISGRKSFDAIRKKAHRFNWFFDKAQVGGQFEPHGTNARTVEGSYELARILRKLNQPNSPFLVANKKKVEQNHAWPEPAANGIAEVYNTAVAERSANEASVNRSEARSVTLTPLLGLPAVFEPSTLAVTYGKGVSFLKAWSKTLMSQTQPEGEFPLWKSLKLAVDEQGNEIQQPNLAQFYDPNKVIYHGHQGAYWDGAKLEALLKEHQLRPDVTVLPAGFVGDEYIRTEGHHHLSGLPEVYETIYGRNGYLLFKTVSEDSEDIADVMFVFAEEGDHVLFPPGYQHISINIGKTPFVMTDWVSTEARSDFKYIKRHNGAPYWVVRGPDGQPQFIKNPRYHGKVPEIRLVQPVAEIPEFGLKKGVPMFNLVKEGKIDLLRFLNDTNESGRYDAIYQKAFVPFVPRSATEASADRSEARQTIEEAEKAKRRAIIGGNWKMALATEKEVTDLIYSLTRLLDKPAFSDVDIVIAPSFVHIPFAKGLLNRLGQTVDFPKGRILLAAQDVSRSEKGAFTGDVSVGQLKDLGVTHVILGHSERRQGVAGPAPESSEVVNDKVRLALSHGLTPIVAVGETSGEHELGQTHAVIRNQLIHSLADLTPGQVANLVIAYEPVWAIGTGKRATAEEANEAQRFIRDLVIEFFGFDAAAKVRIQYGGSVNADNVRELVSQPNIDGALIGGDSLKPENFVKDVEAFATARAEVRTQRERVGTESVAGVLSTNRSVRRFIQLPQLNTAAKTQIQQTLAQIFAAFEQSGVGKQVLESQAYTYQQGTVVDPAILFEGFGDQQDKGYLLGALAIRAVYGNDPVAVPLAVPQEGDTEGLATYKAQLALIGEINDYLVQQGKAKLEVTSSVDQAVKFLKRQGVRKIQAIVGTASQVADLIFKYIPNPQIITQQRFQALVSLDARFQGFVEEFKRFYAIARSA